SLTVPVMPVGFLDVPAGLSGVTAIAAGDYHNLALKGDGTVVAWGNNDYGQGTVPAGLVEVTAISAGYFHSLALKGDGTVVPWGIDEFGLGTVPAGLSGVTAIAAGGHHSLALKGAPALTLKGFYRPVDMGGVQNTVKGGSSVPLKFEVFQGLTELTDVTAVTNFTQQRVNCDPGASTDAIEIVTIGGTSLRYDSTSGQYIQNWKTPRTPDACYKVTATTQDDSTLTALFLLK
ncbi:MAG: PxKF domain-containing protein, partial [Propionicimonas sp.]